jgi:hypothetical protein
VNVSVGVKVAVGVGVNVYVGVGVNVSVGVNVEVKVGVYVGLSKMTGMPKPGDKDFGTCRKASTGDAFPGQNTHAAVAQTAKITRVTKDNLDFERDLKRGGVGAGDAAETVRESLFVTMGWVSDSAVGGTFFLPSGWVSAFRFTSD